MLRVSRGDQDRLVPRLAGRQLHESVNFLAVHLLIWINAAGSVLIDTPTQPHACWVTPGERLGCSEAQFPHRDIGLQIPSPLGWLTIIMVLT